MEKEFRECGLRDSQEAEHVHFMAQDRDIGFIRGMSGSSSKIESSMI